MRLWWKQEEVLEALANNRRVAVKSGNGLGKDFTAAVAVLWYLHTHEPGHRAEHRADVPAGAERAVASAAPAVPAGGGETGRHGCWRRGGSLAEDRYALGLSADGADQFQGFHSENVLVVVDEAEGVEEEIYEAVDAVMTSQNPRLLLIGNPTRTDGSFHRAFHEELGHLPRPSPYRRWSRPT